MTGGAVGFLEAPERKQRGSQASPDEGNVRRLFQGVAQQALGIVRYVGGKRQCGKSAQRRDVTCVFLQDFSKNFLGGFAVICQKQGGSFLDAQSLRVGETRAFECNTCVGVLLKVDQRISVGKPRQMMMRNSLQHPAHFPAGACGTAVVAVSARQIDASVYEIRRALT